MASFMSKVAAGGALKRRSTGPIGGSGVSQIEAGRRKPSSEAMVFFAGRLGVTSQFLQTGVPDGIEDNLRYRLEEARQSLRHGQLEETERLLVSVIGISEEYGFPTSELKRSPFAGI